MLVGTKADAFGKPVRDCEPETQRTLEGNTIVAEGKRALGWALEAVIKIEVIYPVAVASNTSPREKTLPPYRTLSTYSRDSDTMIVDKSGPD